MIDFTNCEPDLMANYGGSDQKKGIIYNGKRYMLKYADKISDKNRNSLNSSYSNSIYSEHICCAILKNLGFDVQNTLLGTINLMNKDGIVEPRPVVACENFIPNGFKLIEFKDIENAVLPTKPGKVPKLSDLNDIFYNENIYFNRETGIDAAFHYWQEFVIDALLGNFDRHANNWGYLINETTHEMHYAPIYDCGSCLYPQIADDAIERILNTPEEIDVRINKFPNAALMLEGDVKANYKNVLLSTNNADCLRAIIQTVPRINMRIVEDTINSQTSLSDIRKTFYIRMLNERFSRILEPAFKYALDKTVSQINVNIDNNEMDTDEDIDGIDPGEDE